MKLKKSAFGLYVCILLIFALYTIIIYFSVTDIVRKSTILTVEEFSPTLSPTTSQPSHSPSSMDYNSIPSSIPTDTPSILD